ncbi:MAG TPA: Uma2 family endonuclease [Methylomirabilota bacterium]|jgi:Uma2 family endonuclease|nr:Uma2 family endonuclease [Methylomirabilota bacterium]
MSRSALLTYADYAALPNDGKRYELHAGALSVTPAPSPQHQIILGNLFVHLDGHVRRHALGRVLVAAVDVIFSNITVLQPDIVWLDSSRLGAISRRAIEGPPTLAVEILSPSTARTDRTTKRALYRRHGVPWLWLVDPEQRTIEVYRDDERVMVASGAEPADLPPFEQLGLVVDSIWD